MKTSYTVRIGREHLAFSAAHFITFTDHATGQLQCEPIHGHNYGVAVTLESDALDDSQCVVDFIMLRQLTLDIITPWDHRVLLPTQSDSLTVTIGNVNAREEEVEVTFDADGETARRWLFPRSDCELLPVRNTTAESLARRIGESLQVKLAPVPSTCLTVDVDEYHGMTGSWRCC